MYSHEQETDWESLIAQLDCLMGLTGINWDTPALQQKMAASGLTNRYVLTPAQYQALIQYLRDRLYAANVAQLEKNLVHHLISRLRHRHQAGLIDGQTLEREVKQLHYCYPKLVEQELSQLLGAVTHE